MVVHHLELGRAGEERAARWYAGHGYEIVARNWRVRQGEIDLVARLGGVLVIAEVKTRRALTHGQPFEAVTPAKQRRLRHLAAAYLAAQPEHRYYEEIRFDVVSVLGAQVQVIEGAF